MTAYRYWENIWRSDVGRAAWVTPDPWIVANVPELRHRMVQRVLDLGCGVGRHTALLASSDFLVQGIDRSRSAVRAARASTETNCDPIPFAVADLQSLPFHTASFDAVLAFNVVYHNDEEGLVATMAEVRRVLRVEGTYLTTMLSKRHRDYGRGIEISANTFCQPDALDDKVHPHLYADLDDLQRLHPEFRLVSADDIDHSDDGSYHWQCDFRLIDG